jgi:hypothetical protein
LDQVGVTLEDQSLVEAIAISSGRQQPNDADRKEAREQTLAMRFIRGTNERYKNYLAHLRNSFLDGSDIYPETVHQAYNILLRREQDTGLSEQQSDGMAFANVGAEDSAGGEHKNKDHIICYDCGDKGHYANQCPKRNNRNIGQHNEDKNSKKTEQPQNQEGTNCCTVGIEGCKEGGEYTFHQSSGSNIPCKWILLDNQSTVDIFCNSSLLLSNIRESSGTMTVHCNAGQRTTNLVGDLDGYGTVWYDPDAIANILSLKKVKENITWHIAQIEVNS